MLDQHQGQCEEAPGMFANFITLGSMLLVLVSLPFSLFFVVKVVQVNTSGQMLKLTISLMPTIKYPQNGKKDKQTSDNAKFIVTLQDGNCHNGYILTFLT